MRSTGLLTYSKGTTRLTVTSATRFRETLRAIQANRRRDGELFVHIIEMACY